jgi:glyoxylase-like metal-dependent hydrolase (beta-lactamase superfamily II)
MDRLAEIADGVLVGTSELYVTTTTVVAGRDGGCLVIDPAVTPADLTDLAAPDPAGGYRAGLELLAALTGVKQVIPGHGHVGDAAEFRRRIAADRRYLDDLERGRPVRIPG